MSASEQMDARFEQHNNTFHATRAFVRVALFHPDTNARSKLVSSRTHLHTQVRSSGSQVYMGKKETPRRAPPGAPTCSHEPLVGCSPTHTNQPTGSQLLQTRRES